MAGSLKKAKKTFAEMGREYASVEGTPSEFVPLKSKVPHYRNLNADQLNYYCYWRHHMRQGRILPPEEGGFGDGDFGLPYIYLYAYELLQHIGVKNARQAHERLLFLTTEDIHCRSRWKEHSAFNLRHDYHRLPRMINRYIVEHMLLNEFPRDEILARADGGTLDVILGAYPDADPGQLPDDTVRLMGHVHLYGPGEADRRADDPHIAKALSHLQEYFVTTHGKGVFEWLPHTYCDVPSYKHTPWEGERAVLRARVFASKEDELFQRKWFKSVVTYANKRATQLRTGKTVSTYGLDLSLVEALDKYFCDKKGLPRPKITEAPAPRPKKKKRPPRKAVPTKPAETGPTPDFARAHRDTIDDKWEYDLPVVARAQPDTVLSSDDWASLVTHKHPPAHEKVVLIQSPKSDFRSFSIPKVKWDRFLTDVQSLVVVPGDELQLTPGDDSTRVIDLPADVVGRLTLRPKDKICVTQRDDKFYLKKLVIHEHDSDVPGWFIADTFTATTVERHRFQDSTLASITDDKIEHLLAKLGRLRHDPLKPLLDATGRVGLIAAREFGGKLTKAKQDELAAYRKSIIAAQSPDGSFDGNVSLTSYNLIRLAEAGVSTRNGDVRRAVEWLLGTVEPETMPGCFVNDPVEWLKLEDARRKGQKVRFRTEAEQRYLRPFGDVVPLVVPEQPRISGASCLAIEALLRFGQADHPRLVRALNSVGHRRAPIDGIFPTLDVPDPLLTAAECFGGPVAEDADWNRTMYGDHVKIDKIAAGYDHRDHGAVAIGECCSLVMKRYTVVIYPSLALYRAWSFHPKHPGTWKELDAVMAIESGQREDGRWVHWSRPAVMLGMLEAFNCPLAAFMVLRTIPTLIEAQGDDGLWNLGGASRESGSLFIVRALKKFGFLEKICPKR